MIALLGEGRLDYRIAQSQQEREAAFRLVYRSYLRTGLTNPNPYELRLTPYHLLPETQVFVGVCRGEVVSTVTLVPDNFELGLPMDSMYEHEVNQLRKAKKVAEVSSLADRRSDPRRFLRTFSEMTRLMAQYARRNGIDALLITVHPRHARFYNKYLGFEAVGGERQCPHVQGNPAVALCLDFQHVDEHRPNCYDDFFGSEVPAALLERQAFLPEEAARYEAVVNGVAGQGLEMAG